MYKNVSTQLVEICRLILVQGTICDVRGIFHLFLRVNLRRASNFSSALRDLLTNIKNNLSIWSILLGFAEFLTYATI